MQFEATELQVSSKVVVSPAKAPQMSMYYTILSTINRNNWSIEHIPK